MSENNALDILLAAKKALDHMKDGKTYTTDYVANRLIVAADQNPHDHLIGNMRDVIQKKARTQNFITQNEIGEIYDQMVGLASGHTAFRTSLGDLLPQSRQMAPVEKTASEMRIDQGKDNLSSKMQNEELSNAFATLFGFGKEASFSSYKGHEDNSVQKVTVAKLSSIGYAPTQVKIAGGNDHFCLATAYFRRKNGSVAIQMPVQNSGGIALPPENFIQAGELVPLTKENLFVAIKDSEHTRKEAAHSKFAGQRDFSKIIEYDKPVVPAALEKFADLENSLVAAASKYNTHQVRTAIKVVSDELKGFGVHNPQVTVKSANDRELLLNAQIPTSFGSSAISVPVEFHNGLPTLPSKFAADGDDTVKVYDFSSHGVRNFMGRVKANDGSLKVARHNSPLGSMSFHQLMDEVISGASSKDYKRSEDALATIQDKFGPEHHKSALDKFSQLLKHSSDYSETRRGKLIKEAVQRGDLIKFPTTLEWFSPKLGLPISKIAFDDKGRMVPARRKAQSDNIVNEAIISTSKILLT